MNQIVLQLIAVGFEGTTVCNVPTIIVHRRATAYWGAPFRYDTIIYYCCITDCNHIYSCLLYYQVHVKYGVHFFVLLMPHEEMLAARLEPYYENKIKMSGFTYA